jgi:hypothetical protein
VSNRVRTRDLRNHNPENGSSHSNFGNTYDDVHENFRQCFPHRAKNDTELSDDPPSENDFTTALLMIDRLPLGDAQKAESVRPV